MYIAHVTFPPVNDASNRYIANDMIFSPGINPFVRFSCRIKVGKRFLTSPPTAHPSMSTASGQTRVRVRHQTSICRENELHRMGTLMTYESLFYRNPNPNPKIILTLILTLAFMPFKELFYAPGAHILFDNLRRFHR